MGHGGTLDPLASGVLIVGIGRGTKDLARFLGGTKTYECVVVFGKSTDTFDAEGSVTGEAGTEGVSEEVVRDQLGKLMGSFKQVPPIYSALKINGVKACEYVRSGQPLPRELEAREVHVDLCELVEFMPAGSHTYRHQLSDPSSAAAPAARIRLTVSSGFYVRSFCHNIGIACGSLGTMADLVRTRQSGYTLSDPPESLESSTAITFGEFVAGEEIWGPKIAAELKDWMEKNPVPAQDRSRHRKRDRTREGENSEKGEAGVRQRFRGEWLATTKKERIKQQGGKRKGKYNQPKSVRKEEEVPQTTTPADGKNNQ
ncbi:pseudouridine synthase [Lentithecium fluviatile CBS 122367]|uniref:tRNA pseudouridine(55) synthase n=1 Tax=Lentithecium fluviatile CBS 122367 TaxID=1168545 RepID=A0A6G1IRX1_9PLEO|nr:pseudouridine synthase [Lentithecium fluviatile CBS 122367]